MTPEGVHQSVVDSNEQMLLNQIGPTEWIPQLLKSTVHAKMCQQTSNSSDPSRTPSRWSWNETNP